MAETGIRRFDELPSRMGFTDIDVLRYSFNKHRLQAKRDKDELEKAVRRFRKEITALTGSESGGKK